MRRRAAAVADERAMRAVERQKERCPVAWELVGEALDAQTATQDWTPAGAKRRAGLEDVLMLLSGRAFIGPDYKPEEAAIVRRLIEKAGRE